MTSAHPRPDEFPQVPEVLSGFRPRAALVLGSGLGGFADACVKLFEVSYADIPGLPGLTPVRRLHLAAETGGDEGQHLPTGLILTPGNGGAQGVESRWHLTPAYSPERESWTLKRLRARTDPVGEWTLKCEAGVMTLAG